MLGVFIGEHENKIDSKFRLSIPVDFRRELEEGDPKWEPGGKASMAIVYGDHRRDHAEVFTIRALMKVLAQIARMPRGSRNRAELQKLYAHQTVTPTLDETGRIVLPPKVREKLKLDGKAVVVGNLDTFLIYHPDIYEAGPSDSLAKTEDFDPDLDPSVYLPADGE